MRDARGAYLNFLRNLTPQIFLLSLALILGRKLDFSRFDINNVPLTFAFFIFLGLFLLSFIANASLFYEEAFAELTAWRKEKHIQLKSENYKGFPYFGAMTLAVWKERRVEFIIAALFPTLMQFIFAGVVGVAVISTINMLHSIHG